MRVIASALSRLRTRYPRTMATLEGELPLRSGAHLYSQSPVLKGAIPNIVYQTWRGTAFGRSHLDHLELFRSRNSEFSFVHFDEAEMDAYMAQAYGGSKIASIYTKGKFGPLRTDIWRYCLLYERGGVYCDIGKALAMPLRTLIPEGAGGVISYERNLGTTVPPTELARRIQHPDRLVLNWALAFAPRHPFIKDVIDGIVAKYPAFAGVEYDKPKDAILRFTGPIHLTECWHTFVSREGLSDVHQAGIDFHGSGVSTIPGSYVRYVELPHYTRSYRCPIVT